MLLQYAEQVFTGLRDVTCAEGEHEVSPSGDVLQHRWYGVLLGYVVDLGVALRLANCVDYQLAVDAWLGHLAGGVDLGDEHGVGRGERGAELPVEGAGTRVTVRLEDGDHPSIPWHGGTGGGEGGGDETLDPKRTLFSELYQGTMAERVEFSLTLSRNRRVTTAIEAIDELLTTAALHRKRTPRQVQLACAAGYSRPVVESIIASLLSRGAGHLRYKGWHGACVQLTMAVMAHNAATVRRIRYGRLTLRAQKFRRLLHLKPLNLLKNKERIN